MHSLLVYKASIKPIKTMGKGLVSAPLIVGKKFIVFFYTPTNHWLIRVFIRRVISVIQTVNFRFYTSSTVLITKTNLS